MRRSAWVDGRFADEIILGMLAAEWHPPRGRRRRRGLAARRLGRWLAAQRPGHIAPGLGPAAGRVAGSVGDEDIDALVQDELVDQHIMVNGFAGLSG